jgi:hypothetical protein
MNKKRTYNRHVNKLEEIHTDTTKKFDLSDQMEYLDRLNNNKMQAKIRGFKSIRPFGENSNLIINFHLKEKLKEIEYNNSKLLNRIIDISRRDNVKKVVFL